MRRPLTLFAVSLATALPPLPASTAELLPEAVEVCRHLGNLGETVMSARQADIEQTALVDVHEKKLDDVAALDFVRRLITLAYREPLAPPADQSRTIASFGGMVHDTCTERIQSPAIIDTAGKPNARSTLFRLLRP